MSMPTPVNPAPSSRPPLDGEATPLRLVASEGDQIGADQLILDLGPGWTGLPPRPRYAGFGLASPARSGLPDPLPWARQFLQWVLEALVGRRPATQLQPLVATWVYEWLRQEAGIRGRRLLGGAPALPSVRSVRVSEPIDGVAEVAAVIRQGPRFRAMAVRLQGLDGSWQCVRLSVI